MELALGACFSSPVSRRQQRPQDAGGIGSRDGHADRLQVKVHFKARSCDQWICSPSATSPPAAGSRRRRCATTSGKGLIRSTRTGGNQRRYQRSELRRVAFHPDRPAGRRLARRDPRGARRPAGEPHAHQGGLVAAVRALAQAARGADRADGTPARPVDRVHRLRLPVPATLPADQPAATGWPRPVRVRASLPRRVTGSCPRWSLASISRCASPASAIGIVRVDDRADGAGVDQRPHLVAYPRDDPGLVRGRTGAQASSPRSTRAWPSARPGRARRAGRPACR